MSKAFFVELEDELRLGIQKILTHPFLALIKDAKLTKTQLQYFAKQYGIYCRYFPRFLAAAASNIPDDETRMPLVENIWEEHGNGVLEKSHRVLFENFAAAVGVSKVELINAMPIATTGICCEHLLDICQDYDFITSLGALGPGTEFFTNEEYLIIEAGLKKYDFLSDSDIEFWTVHIKLDEEHYSEMVRAMLPWTDSLENRHLIKTGAKKAIDLEILFWDGLLDHLPKD